MLPLAATIVKVEDESDRIRTLTLDTEVIAKPGNFLMVWVPGVDEIPLAVSNDKPLQITVSNAGEASGALHRLKKGERVWFRGPYGNSFELPKNAKRILLVCGGYGIAPLRFLLKVAKQQKIDVTMAMGARTKKLLPKKPNCKTLIATDDGSARPRGYVTDILKKLLEQKGKKFNAIYACGPERMMRLTGEIAEDNKIPGQLCAERYMKCGIGICGSCALGDKLVCRDGPVFDFSVLKNAEFGKCRRNACGSRELL